MHDFIIKSQQLSQITSQSNQSTGAIFLKSIESTFLEGGFDEPLEGASRDRTRARERNSIPENTGFPAVSSMRNPPLKGIGNVSPEHVHEHDYEHVRVSGRADYL